MEAIAIKDPSSMPESPTCRSVVKKAKVFCYSCQEHGHFANECPKLKRKELRTTNQQWIEGQSGVLE